MLKQQQAAMEEAREARRAEVRLDIEKELLEKEADLQVCLILGFLFLSN